MYLYVVYMIVSIVIVTLDISDDRCPFFTFHPLPLRKSLHIPMIDLNNFDILEMYTKH